jgi:dGTP triphosphohydrolase
MDEGARISSLFHAVVSLAKLHRSGSEPQYSRKAVLPSPLHVAMYLAACSEPRRTRQIVDYMALVTSSHLSSLLCHSDGQRAYQVRLYLFKVNLAR